jgi:hypothetical protein
VDECKPLAVGLDGFKFDAGEPCFLPVGAKMRRPLRYPGRVGVDNNHSTDIELPIPPLCVCMRGR